MNPAANPAQYKPDALASGAATEKPFAEAGTPKGAPGLTSALLRLALRRLPSRGFAATKMTTGVKPPSNAMTMGSHGQIA